MVHKKNHMANTDSLLPKSDRQATATAKNGERDWAQAGLNKRGKKMKVVVNASIVLSRLEVENEKAINLQLPRVGA